jgi:group I intron endonuclease
MGVIYKITSPSGKIYIGQSVNYKNRLKHYKSLSCKSQIKLYNSLVKYGYDHHVFEIQDRVDNSLLNERERYWQDYYDSMNGGLNCVLTETNDKSGIQSNETIEKRRKKLIGKTRTDEFKQACRDRMSGHKLSESTKRKLSDVMKLNGNKPPTYHGVEHPNYGKSMSSETKLKLRMANLSKSIHSDEWKLELKQRMTGEGNPFYGKSHTDDVKQRLREVKLGTTLNEDTKHKISKAHKGKHVGGNNNSARKVINIKTNKLYSCIKDAAIDNNITPSKLYRWLGNPNQNKTYLRYYEVT